MEFKETQTQEHQLLLRDIIKKAEIKRSVENLTKKELCSIYNINYNFYMNCISERNYPSKIMFDSLNSYLETKTAEVYEKVFAYRSTEEFIRNKNKLKFTFRNGQWKEEFHEKLNIADEDYNNYINVLKKNNVIEESKF